MFDLNWSEGAAKVIFVVYISLWYIERLHFGQTRSTFSVMWLTMCQARGIVFKHCGARWRDINGQLLSNRTFHICMGSWSGAAFYGQVFHIRIHFCKKVFDLDWSEKEAKDIFQIFISSWWVKSWKHGKTKIHIQTNVTHDLPSKRQVIQ